MGFRWSDLNPKRVVESAYSHAKDFVGDAFDGTVNFAEELGNGLLDVGERIFNDVGRGIGKLLGIEVPEIEIEKQVKINLSSSVAKIPVLYGQRILGGVRAFVGVSGVDNEYLHVVLVLCEGEVEEIGDVYINDVISTDARFSGLLNIRKYTGTTVQTADTILQSAFPEWTSSHTLSGLAYVACRFLADQDEERAYSSFPKITCLVKGRKLYDPRTTTTYYTDNPALCLRDYLTNTLYGKGLATTEINEQAFIDAANYCETRIRHSSVSVVGTDISFATSDDSINSTTTSLLSFSGKPFIEVSGSGSNDGFYEIVSVANKKIVVSENLADESAGASISLYKAINLFGCNGVVDTSKRVYDNVKSLLSTFQCVLVNESGKYLPRIEKDETPVMDINETNIIGAWKISGGTKNNRLNQIKVRFSNPDKDYEADMAVKESATYLSDDNGLLLEAEIGLPYEIEYPRALLRGETILKRSREGISATFFGTTVLLKCTNYDVVTITHSTPGWTAKKFRVVNLRLVPSGIVELMVIEHEPSSYDRTVSVEQAPPPDTNLPDPFIVLPPAINPVVSDETVLLEVANGPPISRAKVSWSIPADIFVIEYQVQYKKSIDADWLSAGNAIGRNNNTFFISDVIDSVKYDFRVRSVNAIGAKSVWSSEVQHTIIGKTSNPPDVLTFNFLRQSDGTREFNWTCTEPLPADVRVGGGFKLRYKVGTGGTWATMSAFPGAESLPPGIRKLETNQLSAGSFTFGIKMVDSGGRESDNAVIVQGPLGDPRISDSFETTNLFNDGWPGTKTQCQVNDLGQLIASDQNQWDDLTTFSAWILWSQNPYLSITYQHTTYDLGAITSLTPLVSIVFNEDALTGESITIEEQHSDDNISYSSWAAVGPAVSGRYFRIRFTISCSSGFIIVYSGVIILSGEPTYEDFNDLDTSTIATNAGDFRLPLTKSYTVIKKSKITALQSVGPGWDHELIDKGNIDDDGLRWVASTAYSVGNQVYPDQNDNGHYFQCTTGGTSSSTEPTWPTSGTVNDGSVVWTEYGLQGPRHKIYNGSATLANATIDAEVIGL